jgi:predicted enzyme related to lactoylglutathione lyase
MTPHREMTMQGKFFWYDVMTSDTKAAGEFYARVIGWGTQEQPGMGYTLFTVGSQGVAGLMAIPDEIKDHARPCWMTYIAVDDVDAMAARVEKEGGKIHKGPVDVPGIIRFAVVADPQGAAFLIARGLRDEPMPEIAPGTPGTVGWHELYAGEWQAAFAFYEKLFGWTKADAIDMGPMGTYQLFCTGGLPVGGMMTKPPAVPVPNWGVYFNVEGIDAAIGRVQASGGTVIHGPVEVPGGQWIVQCFDPQGAYFALVAPKR